MKIRVKHNQMEEIEGLHNEYPYAFHHVDLYNTTVPWHWHEELEFNYVVEGTVKVSTTNQTYVFHKDEGFFINSNVLATMGNVEGSIMDSHLFHPIFLGGHFKSVFETKYLNPVLQNKKIEIVELRGNTTQQKKILQKLSQISALQSEIDTEFQTRNLLSDIWLLLLEELKNVESVNHPIVSKNQERILTMMSYIQENYQEKLSLEEIAASASVSKRECLRCFQTCIHQSPTEYLLDYRIEVAKKLLKATNLPVIEVALQTGFYNGAYFSKIFKRICGKTPLAYRKDVDNLTLFLNK